MLVKSDLTSKDASLLSSGICTVLTASIKLWIVVCVGTRQLRVENAS